MPATEIITKLRTYLSNGATSGEEVKEIESLASAFMGHMGARSWDRASMFAYVRKDNRHIWLDFNSYLFFAGSMTEFSIYPTQSSFPKDDIGIVLAGRERGRICVEAAMDRGDVSDRGVPSSYFSAWIALMPLPWQHRHPIRWFMDWAVIRHLAHPGHSSNCRCWHMSSHISLRLIPPIWNIVESRVHSMSRSPISWASR